MHLNNSSKTVNATKYMLSKSFSFDTEEPLYTELVEQMAEPIYRLIRTESSRAETERFFARLLLSAEDPVRITAQLRIELNKYWGPPLPVSDVVTRELANAFTEVASPTLFKGVSDWIPNGSLWIDKMSLLGKETLPLMFNFSPDDSQLSFNITRVANGLAWAINTQRGEASVQRDHFFLLVRKHASPATLTPTLIQAMNNVLGKDLPIGNGITGEVAELYQRASITDLAAILALVNNALRTLQDEPL